MREMGSSSSSSQLAGSFREILLVGLSSFLQTGQFHLKILNDVVSLLGMDFLASNGVDHFFERWKAEIDPSVPIQYLK